MSVVAQLLGFLLLVLAACLLWSVWALVPAGVVLLAGPELVRSLRQRAA